MGTEHKEGVVEKAVAYVKDIFGIPPGDHTPAAEPKTEYIDTAPDTTAENAMRLDPDAYTFQTVGELHVESRRRTDGEY